jgi:hypothetical protein
MSKLFTMLLRTTDFFRYMSENREHRFYYVLPIDQRHPYAYEHSTVRDVGSLCDILELVLFLKENKLKIEADFESVIRSTLSSYYIEHWENIGGAGFFLLALKSCSLTYPALLPADWQELARTLMKKMIAQQKPDGSIPVDGDLSAEAFYLPEALIGLIAVLDLGNHEVEEAIRRALAYQESTRAYQIGSSYATFYYNWQFQLLYRWIKLKREPSGHFMELMREVKKARIAHTPFDSSVATVEVACYMEGLAHGRQVLAWFGEEDLWIDKEINRCLDFLYELQNETLSAFYGGFIHSRFSDEARIDVAGHVLCALRVMIMHQSLGRY